MAQVAASIEQVSSACLLLRSTGVAACWSTGVAAGYQPAGGRAKSRGTRKESLLFARAALLGWIERSYIHGPDRVPCVCDLECHARAEEVGHSSKSEQT